MNTILVIEDQWSVRELFAIELASERMNIVATGDVDSIREKIRASNHDLVLLDIFMKGIDGRSWWTLKRRIRSFPCL